MWYVLKNVCVRAVKCEMMVFRLRCQSEDHVSLTASMQKAPATCSGCQAKQKKEKQINKHELNPRVSTSRHPFILSSKHLTERVTCLTFVTQQSSPVDVTHTLPGFGAASIHTAGECHTLVTQRAFPAIMTPEEEAHSSFHVHRIDSNCFEQAPFVTLCANCSCC